MPKTLPATNQHWETELSALRDAVHSAVPAVTGKETKTIAKFLPQLERFNNYSSTTQYSAAMAYALWLDVEIRRLEGSLGEDTAVSSHVDKVDQAVSRLIHKLWDLRTSQS